ncbi:hypothetical protein [Variovorax soli]|uniref:Uncharacterized protein n=1 Tax=Variovorax soli TaxID=376815 RepID=A0ABU1NJL7_9BURK|nr:hypothetical protein [Variovorax soli]MDR6538655.1 hypothetical protein [Variovorax soli]
MTQRSDAIDTLPHDLDAYPPRRPASRAEMRQATLCRHWKAIKAQGITASQFIAFLQPLADLDGITVSYLCGDDTREAQPRERMPSFALNEDGRVWIESNFAELKDLFRDL